MKQIVVIVSLFFTSLILAQAEVNYLNYDPFFESDSLSSNPVLPVVGSTKKVGYILTENLRNRNKEYSTVIPVVDLAGSYTTDAASFYSGLGVGITGQYKDDFYARVILSTSYSYETDSILPFHSLYRTDYLTWAQKTGTIGLQPQVRLSYSPYDFLNIQAGIDQQFIGQGNRSILMSDYSAPHPFVQLRTKVWRIEVTNLYQFFKEHNGTRTVPKFASTHFFNYNITSRLQLGLFESVVFSPKDTTTYRGYEPAYLNPFLFYRPTEYGLGSQDRLLIGLNISYEFNKAMIYGQFAFDEFVLKELIGRTRWWANKYTGQIGVKAKHTFGNDIKFRWLSELNFARPFTYSHAGLTTSYSNQGRPLAHPLGANYVEVYAESSIELPIDVGIKTRFFYVQQGGWDGDETISYGKDVNVPYTKRPPGYEYGYRIGGDGQVNRFHFSVEGNYKFLHDIALEAFVRMGVEVNDFSGGYRGQFLIMGGVKTSLWNERGFSF